jgi:hypothetical protein
MALGVRRSRRIAVTLCLVVTMLLAGAALNVSSASAATPSAATSASIARALLHAINTKRASSHLPALRMDARLMASAHRHNLAMAHRDTMSHLRRGLRLVERRREHRVELRLDAARGNRLGALHERRSGPEQRAQAQHRVEVVP